MLPLAQPPRKDDRSFDDWMYRLWKRIAATAGIAWSIIDKTGSNLTDIQTRNHNDLQNIAGGASNDYSHLTAAQNTALTGGAVTTLHKHETTYVNYPASLAIGTPTHINTLQDLLDHSWSAGITDGCALTNNGDGTISIASGNATIRASADPHSALYNVGVTAQANISLTNNATNYVYLSYNGGTPTFLVGTSIASFNGMDKVLTYVVHRLGTVLHTLDVRNQNVDPDRKSVELFLHASRFIHASGGSVLGNPSSLYISLTAGSFYFMLNEIAHIAFDTSVAGTANANVFQLWYRDGAGGWTESVNQKLVSTTTYDNNSGTPATLANNKYGVTWFYVINDSPSELHAIMGQAEYANAAAAAIATPPSSVPSIIEGLGSLVGFVTYEKSAVAFTDIKSAFVQVFGSSAATSHNGLAGLQGGAVNEYYHLTSAQSSLIPSGTPSVGQIPIATSSTTSAWGTITSVTLATARAVATLRV